MQLFSILSDTEQPLQHADESSPLLKGTILFSLMSHFCLLYEEGHCIYTVLIV